MTIHLSIILFVPLLTGLVGAFLPRDAARWTVLIGTVIVLAYVVAILIDYEPGGGLQYVTDDEWIPELGIRYTLGVNGLSLFMIALTAIAWVPCTLVAAFTELERPGSSSSTSRWPRPPSSARSWRRTSRSSSSSST